MKPANDTNKLERLKHLWKSNRIYKWLIAIIIANFFAYGVGTIVFGGDAVNGKAQDGHYYLYGYSSDTGKKYLHEVSHAVYTYSLVHTVSVFITLPFLIILALVNMKIENSIDGIRGSFGRGAKNRNTG